MSDPPWTVEVGHVPGSSFFWWGHITFWPQSEWFAHGLKIRHMGHHTVVSAGLLALAGEIIVLDIGSPPKTIGIANGTGELRRIVSTQQRKVLDEVARELIGGPVGQ